MFAIINSFKDSKIVGADGRNYIEHEALTNEFIKPPCLNCSIIAVSVLCGSVNLNYKKERLSKNRLA